MRIDIPFCGQAYKEQSTFISPAECINLYLHPYPELGENRMALLGTPGLRLFANLGGVGESRAMISFGGFLYTVIGNKFYKVWPNGAYTHVGTLQTSSGRVGIDTNGLDIIMVDGPHGYVYDLTTGAFTQIVDADFPGGDVVVQVDGYYLVNNPGTGQVYRSDYNNGLSWEGLAFSTAGGDPDPVVGLVVDHRDVYVIGEKTTEIWYNTGTGTFNFDRIDGAFTEQGGSASHAQCKANNAVYSLGRDALGVGQVFQYSGRQPKVVSTFPVDYAISKYTLSDAFMWPYQQLGHTFVALTFPTSNITWVYDSTMGLWHQRSSLYTGVAGRWRAYAHAVFNGQHIVGDATSGKLYILDPEVYDEDGTELVATRTTSVLRKKQDRITVDEVQVVTEPGVGLITGDAEDVDPKGMLSWSKDGGRTWSAEVDIPLGKIGETENVASVTQLGQGRNWAFRLRISAAVKRTILGAVAEVEQDD